ncbi:hypothetical protein AB0F17_58465 [Nonomuraea sp. NPDC026600]|uniref:hypothetical protein n=1 Tax=Nonomuraea sp. NPDC026600 TaxID=3155363 RepID=UPI0033DB7534
MSEPAVVAGLSILGIPPLPDTGLLDQHISEMDRAAAYHRRLVQDGGHAYRLAGTNEGPATDALHAYMTSRDGAGPQAADLADRLTTAAGNLRISKGIIEWAEGLLASVAVAAGIAIAFAPQLLPRLAAMGTRFIAMLRNALSRAGRIFTSLLKTRQARRIDAVADRLHDAWRTPRRLPGGGYEPRVKTTTDQAWIKRRGTDEVDIANTRYKDLPADWQKENKESATVAVRLVDDARKHGADLKGEKFMESASESVHDAWLRRNGEWAPPEQKLPYHQLSQAEKEKDRVVVREALAKED